MGTQAHTLQFAHNRLQLCSFVPFLGPFLRGNFRRKMTTIVGNHGQLWTSTLSPPFTKPPFTLCKSVLDLVGPKLHLPPPPKIITGSFSFFVEFMSLWFTENVNMITWNNFWGINFHGSTEKFGRVSAQREAMWAGEEQGLPEIKGKILGELIYSNYWKNQQSERMNLVIFSAGGVHLHLAIVSKLMSWLGVMRLLAPPTLSLVAPEDPPEMQVHKITLTFLNCSELIIKYYS